MWFAKPKGQILAGFHAPSISIMAWRWLAPAIDSGKLWQSPIIARRAGSTVKRIFHARFLT